MPDMDFSEKKAIIGRSLHDIEKHGDKGTGFKTIQKR